MAETRPLGCARSLTSAKTTRLQRIRPRCQTQSKRRKLPVTVMTVVNMGQNMQQRVWPRRPSSRPATPRLGYRYRDATHRSTERTLDLGTTSVQWLAWPRAFPPGDALPVPPKCQRTWAKLTHKKAYERATPTPTATAGCSMLSATTPTSTLPWSRSRGPVHPQFLDHAMALPMQPHWWRNRRGRHQASQAPVRIMTRAGRQCAQPRASITVASTATPASTSSLWPQGRPVGCNHPRPKLQHIVDPLADYMKLELVRTDRRTALKARRARFTASALYSMWDTGPVQKGPLDPLSAPSHCLYLCAAPLLTTRPCTGSYRQPPRCLGLGRQPATELPVACQKIHSESSFKK